MEVMLFFRRARLRRQGVQSCVVDFNCHVNDVVVCAVCERHNHVCGKTIAKAPRVAQILCLLEARVSKSCEVKQVRVLLSNFSQDLKTPVVVFFFLKCAFSYVLVLQPGKVLSRPVRDQLRFVSDLEVRVPKRLLTLAEFVEQEEDD